MASPASAAELSLQEQFELKCREADALKEKLREVVAAAECSEERIVNKVRLPIVECHADFETR